MKHFPLITIQVIPHKDQDYPTVGNYTEIDEDCTDFDISKLPDWRMESLVAVHEMIEYILVKHRGINISDIDKFDKSFEKKRKKGNTDEPGDDKKAPYFKEHQFATKIERMLAAQLGVKWSAYNKLVNEL